MNPNVQEEIPLVCKFPRMVRRHKSQRAAILYRVSANPSLIYSEGSFFTPNGRMQDCNLLAKNPAKSVHLTMSKKKTERLPISKGVTPHLLRHTFLTQLQAAGRVDIKTLQSIAGHSKIAMTMNTYVHEDVGNVEKISRTSDGLFSRA